MTETEHTTPLRHIRERSGYSQEELSELAGVSQNAISDLELGRRKARGSTLRKLANALGVAVADLLPDEGSDSGKGPAPSEGRLSGTEVTLAEAFALAEAYLEQRRNASRQLREWRSFAEKTARDWEVEGREITPDEIRTVLRSLEGRIESGVLEIRHHKHEEVVDKFVDTRALDASDDFELEQLHKAVARLGVAADPVLQREQADRERARFEIITGGLAGDLLRQTG